MSQNQTLIRPAAKNSPNTVRTAPFDLTCDLECGIGYKENFCRMRSDGGHTTNQALRHDNDRTFANAVFRSLADAKGLSKAGRGPGSREDAGGNPRLRLPRRIIKCSPEPRILGLQPCNVASQEREPGNFAPEPHVLGIRRTAAKEPRYPRPHFINQKGRRTLYRINRLNRSQTRTNQDNRPDNRQRDDKKRTGFP